MEQNGEQILFERNFLGRKFWGACFGGADSFKEEILPANFFGVFLRVKCHSVEERILGNKSVLERKDMGSKKF